MNLPSTKRSPLVWVGVTEYRCIFMIMGSKIIHSSNNTYSTSDGQRLTRSQIESKIRKAKAQKVNEMLLQFNYHFCEDCKRSSGDRLDCSHDVSVKKALETGQAELAYDVNNITIRCRKCHNAHDQT